MSSAENALPARNSHDDLARANTALAALIEERERAYEERNVLRRMLAKAEEAERRRLSREIHDQLGQHLAALTLGLHEVERLLPEKSEAQKRLSALRELALLLARDTRYLALEVRPPELDDVGLESAVTSYAEQWSRRYGIPVEVQAVGLSATQASDDVSTTVYRIMQEALTNVARHAQAAQASVILEETVDELRLIVEDDGLGFNAGELSGRAASEEHMGLAGMKERAELVDGGLTVESGPGRGTTIFARIPIR